MCIFVQPVTSVNNTKIFARRSGRGTQFLAYQMNYQSPAPNAMILPVPVRRPTKESFLRFIDLKSYPEFFDDLGSGFPYWEMPCIGCSAPPDQADRVYLKVFKVGNYVASFVPSLSDFDRLDAQFRLPRETWAKIPAYEGFGFAVFQLSAGSLKPHPMAFEYETDRSDLFFPTVHIHDGMVHESESFDHVLYMQHAGLDGKVSGYQNSHVVDESTGLIRSKYRAARFCDVDRTQGLVVGSLLVHRKILRGNLPNTDISMELDGDPLTPKVNLRPLLSYAPWLAAVAGVGWFLNRRSTLRAGSAGRASGMSNE